MGRRGKLPAPRLPLGPKLKLLLLFTVGSAVRRKNGTVNRRLLSFFETTEPPNPKPVKGVRCTDFTIDQSRNLCVRAFLPAEPERGPVPAAVFFHGGGFAYFSPALTEYDHFCRRLCRTFGFPVISVDYRLAPEHKYPAQYEDGVDVLRFLSQTKASGFKGEDPLMREFFQTVDLSCCFLMGDSAGGNLAHNVARRWTDGEDAGLRLAGIALLHPFFGGEERVPSELRVIRWTPIDVKVADWLWRAFLPPGATRDHPAANPRASAEGLGENFPPVLVLASELDPLLDWQRLYVESLKKNGKKAEKIEYPRTIHCFHVFPELKESQKLVDDVAGFLHRLRDSHEKAG